MTSALGWGEVAWEGVPQKQMQMYRGGNKGLYSGCEKFLPALA